MIIVWVFLFYCLGLSGKEDLIYMFNLNLIFKITGREQGPRLARLVRKNVRVFCLYFLMYLEL